MKKRALKFRKVAKQENPAGSNVSESKPKIDFFKDDVVRLTPEEARAYRCPGDPRDVDDAFIEVLAEAAKK